jgi:hypothetical protein
MIPPRLRSLNVFSVVFVVLAIASPGSAAVEAPLMTRTVTPAHAQIKSSEYARTFAAETAYLNGRIPRPKKAIRVSSAKGFARAVARARAGQTIDVRGNVLVSGEFKGFDRVVAGGTVNVVFEPGAGFVGKGDLNAAAVFITHSGGWRIWGGTISNSNGSGILMYATPGPFVWTGFVVHDTANTCVSVFPIFGDISNVTLKGVAGTADPNLALDPHTEKGTGIHAWNLGDGPGGGVVRNSTFAAQTVDQATGAAVEIDTSNIGTNVVVYASATHLGFPIPGTTWDGYAKQQTAGNVIQLWGGTLTGSLDIRYAQADDIQGRILQTGGMYPGASLVNASIDYGIATGPILQDPLITKIAYEATDGLRLGNCLPLP